jgi:hypothetical protein
MSGVKIAYNGQDKFRANYDRIFGVSRETVNNTPHASDEGIPPPSLSSCEPRGVTITEMQPIHVSGVVHNPFTGDCFLWVL